MRIALISREYPPDTHVGGIATYTSVAAHLMAKHGHEVLVLCNGKRTEILKDGPITVHRIAMGQHALPQGRWWFRWRNFARQCLPGWLDALTWAKTVGRYAAAHLDIPSVQAWEWPETNGEGAYLPPLPSHAIRICRIHTSWLAESWHHPLDRWLLLRLQKRACKNASKIVSPSQAMAQGYGRALLGCKSIEVSPNPILPWSQPVQWERKKARHLLFVGRMEYRKGIDVLMNALSLLAEEDLAFTLRLVGALHPPNSPSDEEAQAILRRSLRTHGEKGRPIKVEFPGPCDHQDLHRHLDWTGLLIMPSRMDNYPYVLMEGLSRGCCLLASDVGGVSEICGNQPFGFLTPPGQAANLAAKMREWLKGGEDRHSLWRMAADFAASRFGEEAGYWRLHKLYSGENGP